MVSNVEQSFLWAFQKTDHPEMEEPNHNYPKTQLKIHSIKIKGTVDGGASECEQCNTVRKHAVDYSDTRVCEPCPMGQFYAPTQSRCMECPQGKINIMLICNKIFSGVAAEKVCFHTVCG